MSEKKFPILGTNESIDWNLIAPHEKQAMENHCGQTLEQLARRHGLSWYELLCVMADKKILVEIEYDKGKDYEKMCRQALLLEEVKQYRAIGTPEECLRNKDFLRFLANSMNQKKYETYLRIYNVVEKEGRDE